MVTPSAIMFDPTQNLPIFLSSDVLVSTSRAIGAVSGKKISANIIGDAILSIVGILTMTPKSENKMNG